MSVSKLTVRCYSDPQDLKRLAEIFEDEMKSEPNQYIVAAMDGASVLAEAMARGCDKPEEAFDVWRLLITSGDAAESED